jgi:hypothetical protein
MLSKNFPEKFLYHIWDEQHIISHDDNKALQTVSGKRIKIHFQGHFNTMSGPDFKNATIEIDGQNFLGDVEIHIHSSDWYHHQHDQNPAFNRVILHVVYQHNHHIDMTLSEENEQIEIFEIQSYFSQEIEKLFHAYTENNMQASDRFCQLFSRIRNEFFRSFLHEAGLERLDKKIKRHKTELSFVSIDQLFYQGILEALGYHKNKNQFYMFSKEHQWTHFTQICHSSSGLSFDTFIDYLVSKADFVENKYNWHTFRIRPANHPRTRLYQIAPFLYASLDTSLTSEIQKLFSFVDDDFSVKKLTNRIYDKLCVASSLTKYRLGKDRVDTIIINIFIPILIVYAQMVGDEQLDIYCKRIYTEFGALEKNHIDHLMQKYMTADQYDISQQKAIYQQGLLHIYHKYCQNHLCEICKLYWSQKC